MTSQMYNLLIFVSEKQNTHTITYLYMARGQWAAHFMICISHQPH